MKVKVEQNDLIRALKGYVEHLGISLANKEVSVEFKAGRTSRTTGKKNPSYAVIEIIETKDSFAGLEPQEPDAVHSGLGYVVPSVGNITEEDLSDSSYTEFDDDYEGERQNTGVGDSAENPVVIDLGSEEEGETIDFNKLFP